MSNVTYDPIREIVPLRRIRVFKPVAPPPLGTCLVLEPDEGPPLVIEAGQRVPEARLGHYKRAYVVDLGRYGLRLEERLPSADPAFQFTASVSFTCRVHNPAIIATRGVRDITAFVRLPMAKMMRAVSRSYDIGESNDAEAALNAQLETFTGDSAVQLGGYLVELEAGGGAARSSAEFHDTSREIRMDRMRRAPMSEVVSGGRDALRAQWLATHGGDPSELLEFEEANKAREAEQLLRAIGALSGDKAAEPFDTRDERRRLMSHLLGESAEGRPKRGSLRQSRIAGSLAGTSSKTSEKDSVAPPEENGQNEKDPPVSRLRGTGKRRDPDQ
ncbi:hypothetical protein [Amycolatopsis sp. H20-H5]|uniref:hypothetical protein n=1 Tax=Amycolatopsis sp. H20-H5 TaxID=3046309 RepID=UPI002DBD4807|nr:hypothetical protein [Amycolatopsis sp. H20-H5]MEC3975717.1 hypothetical protein [Amycolatopsis sp. H20-H5]